MAKKSINWDDESNEIPSNWVKFNTPLEDKIKGTLIAKRQVKSQFPGKEGELVWVYELKASEGSFHTLDEKGNVVDEPIVIESGSIWSIGGKPMIDRQMQNIRVGQVIGFKFIEEQKSKTKGFAPAKVIKVYAPKNNDGTPQMDEEFMSARTADEDFDKL